MSMQLVVNKGALQATLISSFGLILVHLLALLRQGLMKFKAGLRPPEDQHLAPQLGKQDFDGISKWVGNDDNKKEKYHKENAARWTRIVGNNIENIPFFLGISWGTLLIAHSAELHIVCVLTYMISRMLYTLFYAYSLQPYRAVAWTIANLAVLVLCGNGMMAVFLT